MIISISQSKGGSCKTTTAINLAGAIKQRSHTVIVCDMDKDKPDACEWAKQANHYDNTCNPFNTTPLGDGVQDSTFELSLKWWDNPLHT